MLAYPVLLELPVIVPALSEPLMLPELEESLLELSLLELSPPLELELSPLLDESSLESLLSVVPS